MSQKQPTPPPVPSSSEDKPKSSSVSNKDLVHMAFRALPAYFGLCLGFLITAGSEDGSDGEIWYILAVLTGLISLVSWVAFWFAGQRAYAQWMLTAEEVQQVQATESWRKIQASSRLFFLLGLLLGVTLGFLGMHELLTMLS